MRMGGRGVFLPSCDDACVDVEAEEAEVQQRLQAMVVEALREAAEET